MEASSLSKRPPSAVTNLVPKIKNLLAEGDKAGIRYYRAAGVELNQIKSEWNVDGFTFAEWAETTFDRSPNQLYRYMRLEAVSAPKLSQRGISHSLGEQPRHERGWEAAARPVVNRVNVRAMAQERQDREEEERLQRILGNQLIDIGYKVLATKLHPDKPGGSHEAMARLGTVKRILKGAL